MDGNIWMFSDQIDDEDLEFMTHEFVTYKMACNYYRLGLKVVTRLSHECGGSLQGWKESSDQKKHI